MPELEPSLANESRAEEHIAALFRADGWEVDIEQHLDALRADLIARKGPLRYVVEVKATAEGRPDRVVALLSQAILQANRYADLSGMRPLAVVLVGQSSPSLLQKVEQFQRDYAPAVAIGLVSRTGERRFIGQGLDALNVEAARKLGGRSRAALRKTSDLFSDLNQWMLKVLLAPELPAHLLHAPRGEYRTGSELAEAARVSPMSASRFVRRLHEEGFLEDSAGSLQLVRRRELFRRWQSVAMRSSPELKMTYLIPAAGRKQLVKAVSGVEACVGLFAAADLLQLSHVSGVAAHVYVRRLSASRGDALPGLVPAAPGEPVQVILKQANWPESMFRAAVRVDGAMVSDVLQIWLDASVHPSRGAEQADFLRDKVLLSVLGAGQ